MNLQPLKGDIVDVAPKIAEAAVLWLCSGFTHRFSTWHFRLREAEIVPLTPDVPNDRPWLGQVDSIWYFESPLGQLRYLYIFSNPQDLHGYRDVQNVYDAVGRCMDRLNELNVRRIAMIHIPACDPDILPTRADSLDSATAMIESLRSWSERNPESIEEVFLVDLQDDFATVL